MKGGLLGEGRDSYLYKNNIHVRGRKKTQGKRGRQRPMKKKSFSRIGKEKGTPGR